MTTPTPAFTGASWAYTYKDTGNRSESERSFLAATRDALHAQVKAINRRLYEIDQRMAAEPAEKKGAQ